jgi:hypothetical protein
MAAERELGIGTFVLLWIQLNPQAAVPGNRSSQALEIGTYERRSNPSRQSSS